MLIRKQVYDLRLEDFERHPVWEFALDEEGEEGQDEATVRPYSVAGPADSAEGTLVVSPLHSGRWHDDVPLDHSSVSRFRRPGYYPASDYYSRWAGLILVRRPQAN
jgi:hypothetical protein